MSLLLLFDTNESTEVTDSPETEPKGLLRALLYAIHKEDDRIAGNAVSRVLETLSATATTLTAESTIGFGEDTTGSGDALLLINGEVIRATGRTSAFPYTFTTLTRGVNNTVAKIHPVGSLIFDISRSTSALDRLRRGIFVDTATGNDLDVIARNLGLDKCPGLTEEQWRRIIKALAYLPKQTNDAFYRAMHALTNDDTIFDIYERNVSDPWKVFVDIALPPSLTIEGRFNLNGAEPQLTTGLNTVITDYPAAPYAMGVYPLQPSQVRGLRTFDYPAGAIGTTPVGVYLDTPAARRGDRSGTNYVLPGGNIAGNIVTLGTSPGPIGTPVLVDYGAFNAHYLAADETVRDSGDRWAYLADPLLTVRCILDHIRAAGVEVVVSNRV